MIRPPLAWLRPDHPPQLQRRRPGVSSGREDPGQPGPDGRRGYWPGAGGTGRLAVSGCTGMLAGGALAGRMVAGRAEVAGMLAAGAVAAAGAGPAAVGKFPTSAGVMSAGVTSAGSKGFAFIQAACGSLAF